MERNVQEPCFSRERPRLNRHITKDDIGYPSNFIHTVHISWNPDGVDIQGDESVLSTVLQKNEIPKEVKAAGFNFQKRSMTNERRLSEESFSGYSFKALLKEDELENNVILSSTSSSVQKRASLPSRNSAKELHPLRSISQENIGNPYDFRHVCHVTWDLNSGFRIRSDVPSLGEILQKEIMCSKVQLKRTSTLSSKLEYSENEQEGKPLPEEGSSGSSRTACLHNVKRDTDDMNIPHEPRLLSSVQLDVSEDNHEKPKHKSRINKDDIGNPFEFRHISHIGWDAENGFNRW